MSLEENNSNGFYMPVAPAYGGGNGFGGGFGGDWGWIILLLLCGWGNGGFGGMGGWGGMMGMGFDFPWLLNGQNGINNNVNDGFRDAQLHDSVTSVRDGVSNLATQLCGCCGDIQMGMANGLSGVQQSLCNGFAGTTAAVTAAQNGITQQLYSNELASLNRSFAEQTANTQGFTGVNSGLSDLRYVVATEACADRAAVGDALQAVTMQGVQNTNALMTTLRDGIQAIKDELCNDRLEAERRDNANLRAELMYARGQADRVAQTADIRASQATTANQLVSELRSCPIPAQPVYGNQPIFQCSGPTWNNNGCGCGNNGFGFNG